MASVRVEAPLTSTILTLPSGLYWITVKACDQSCLGLYYPVHFRIDLPPVPATAPVITQSAVTLGNRLDVSWSPVPNADLYRVHVVQPGAGPGGGALTIAGRQVSTTSAQLSVPSGPASVIVAACTGDGCGPFSPAIPIQPSGPSPAAPVIGTPMAGTVTNGPTVLFTWSRVPGDNGSNTTYRLYVADLSLFATAADVFTSQNFAAVQLQTDGRRYDALVVANPGQPNQVQGPPSGFQVAGTPPFAPTLASPAYGGNARQGLVRLTWSPFGPQPYPFPKPVQFYVAAVNGGYSASGTAEGTFVELYLPVLNGQPTPYSAVIRSCQASDVERRWYNCRADSEAFWGPWSNSPGGPGVTNFTLLP